MARALDRLARWRGPNARVDVHFAPPAPDDPDGPTLWTRVALAHPADLAAHFEARPGFARAVRVPAAEPSLGAPRASDFDISLMLGPNLFAGDPPGVPRGLIGLPRVGHLYRRERVDEQPALDRIDPTKHFRAWTHVYRRYAFERAPGDALEREIEADLRQCFGPPDLGVRAGALADRATGRRPTDDVGCFLAIEGVGDPVTEAALLIHVFERLVSTDLLDRHGGVREVLPRGPWLGRPRDGNVTDQPNLEVHDESSRAFGFLDGVWRKWVGARRGLR